MKLLVSFSRKKGFEPLIAKTVMDTQVLINVERANIESMSGEVLIDVPDKDAHKVCKKLREAGADVERLDESVRREEGECVDCGECISICPQEVFYFDEDWSIQMKTDNCVLCGKCITSCPHGALRLLQ
ncbi:NAD-dependent dihydropyrimidine dehydrogenase PreA subunit [Methanomicrobium sp. W14]|uniref:4Fe-4S binding protein n=1 Tax=Methanomicrobium sp. W14 TaxID=2817839 RepID=UPI001AE71483|nr:4Fe-4S binding protein [Methanomicrobium sp. W14]MBP2132578.1 NAD-dependent dihydropyrimidine dehydrogenase PreA subunit [Methanomicrobium sp. W14]